MSNFMSIRLIGVKSLFQKASGMPMSSLEGTKSRIANSKLRS